jgi:hypothetical protein
MKTNIYVDGFNLYYGCLKGTPYKWLNIFRMCELLLPNHEITELKYFTARVKPRPEDQNQPVRQQIYFRALRTLPNTSIIQGRFLSKRVSMPLAKPTLTQKTALVIKTEEKGSDVNLATHLLADGFRARYECAVLITNDSDLLLPIQFVSQELNFPVGILNPQKTPSRELLSVATFTKQIREGVLRESQFPVVLQDANGSFTKPDTWQIAP